MTYSPALCGKHLAVVFDRGGQVQVGVLEGLVDVRWNRIRDEISEARVQVVVDLCCDLLNTIEPVQNELHLYRDGLPVWQGIITRMEFQYDLVELYAEDMLWVAKRRALSRGYNYQTPCAQCEPGPVYGTGAISAIEHADELLRERCYEQFGDEWNMVSHLNPVVGPCDPDSSRQVNAWSVTVWQELDALAEDHGIDYCVVGRDIYWFDIHLKWVEIEPLAAEHIADAPRIVEYGNSLATRYIRTDGSGWAGISTATADMVTKYGTYVDVIASETTQAEANPPLPGAVIPDPPSTAQLARWTATAAGRLEDLYPVRRSIVIPANTTLLPGSPWDVNTLMPGSWTLTTVDRLCRGSVTEWQRLHEVRVNETGGEGETVQVSMVSAPTRIVEVGGEGCP